MKDLEGQIEELETALNVSESEVEELRDEVEIKDEMIMWLIYKSYYDNRAKFPAGRSEKGCIKILRNRAIKKLTESEGK